MKFIIDAQLPPSLAVFFAEHDLTHTKDLYLGNKTTDSDINSISIKEKRILITKDSDFYYSYIASRKPYKLILVRLGNIRINELKDYFRLNASKILELIKSNSFLILEKDRIRIMD
jgi:predicted nuclease of predicted toxin-antitoxin system